MLSEFYRSRFAAYLAVAALLTTAAGAAARGVGNHTTPVAAANASTGGDTKAEACPGDLLQLLERLQLDQVDGITTTNGSAQGSVPAWPPRAPKQGLACTVEVSQLAVALPGSSTACGALSIRNNLLSVLHSWQLQFRPARDGGLVPADADGALLIPAPEEGEAIHVCMAVMTTAALLLLPLRDQVARQPCTTIVLCLLAHLCGWCPMTRLGAINLCRMDKHCRRRGTHCQWWLAQHCSTGGLRHIRAGAARAKQRF